ncbi:DUF421 domain-containing protein [Nocardioides houyundeii]|uniref:DUF421 domain-containing protein n=1 Tax=Nocardioides houyundeii TaxID=2045452 RepID=UPI000C773290|nr:YetF domain-containing protein [Nocardioides houyundeii]
MDIVIRAVVVFAFLWVAIRISGKREVAQLSAFDMILLVTVGDLISQGILQEDYSLTAAMLAVSTFALAAMALAFLTRRFPRARPVLEGLPRIVIRDGEPLLNVLASEQLTFDDLAEGARQNGIRRFSDVELAVLETDGVFSFFTRPAEESDPRDGAATDDRPL